MKAQELYERLYEALHGYQVNDNFDDLVAQVTEIANSIDTRNEMARSAKNHLERWIIGKPVSSGAMRGYDEAVQYHALTCFWAGLGCWCME